MLATIKRAVGGGRAKSDTAAAPALDREALDRPVDLARERLAVANRDHEASMARVAEVTEHIREATAAFDRDGSEANADRLVDLRRELERQQLFSQRTQRAVVVADGEHAQAITARRAALAEHLRARMASINDGVRKLWEDEGAAAVGSLAAFSVKLDALLDDARAATQEAGAMGILDAPAWTKIHGIEGLRGAVKAWISDHLFQISPSVRVKVEGLFG